MKQWQNLVTNSYLDPINPHIQRSRQVIGYWTPTVVCLAVRLWVTKLSPRFPSAVDQDAGARLVTSATYHSLRTVLLLDNRPRFSPQEHTAHTLTKANDTPRAGEIGSFRSGGACVVCRWRADQCAPLGVQYDVLRDASSQTQYFPMSKYVIGYDKV